MNSFTKFLLHDSRSQRARNFAKNKVLPNLPAPLSRRLKKWAIETQRGEVGRVIFVETKLWGGYSRRALPELAAIEGDFEQEPGARIAAAEALSAWHASHGDFERSREHAIIARLLSFARVRTETALLESDACMMLEQPEAARRALESRFSETSTSSHVRLAYANTFTQSSGPGLDDDDERRLQLINFIYERAGVVGIRKADPNLPLTIENLDTEPAVCAVSESQQQKVSILMPTYNAADTLALPVTSLLKQSWSNLEILIVDDCSSDDTLRVAEELARSDSRVRVIRQQRNQGAYPARNLGLRHATGELVTVHDTDDWSHPQKLEVQVQAIMRSDTPPAVLSNWVRCYHHLFFRPQARVQKTRVMLNSSSLLLRREYLQSIGGWDEVRVGADTELIHRLEHGHGRIPRLLKGVPLSFALERPDSLTQQGATHVNTRFFGVRRDYRESARYWLALHGEGAVPNLPRPEEGRAFPAPLRILPEKGQHAKLDLLVIMDFALLGGAFVSTFNYVLAAVDQGLKVGVFHWRRYDLDTNRILDRRVQKLVHEGKVHRVSAGDKLTADTVLVGYPVILTSPIDCPPQVECQRFGIITNQMSARLYSGGDVQYDPQQVVGVVRELFGVTPFWIPISDLVRKLMSEDGRYSPVHGETWCPLVDTKSWCARPPEFRGKTRARPVLGRHARDHYTKWPDSKEAIEGAYCAGRPVDVALLGGADVPQEILGKRPKNWTVHSYGSLESKAFLEDLDFFVHYPHPDYIEEFGRAVIEAMAVGIPVILPPIFEPTFGEAALYSEPEGVYDLVRGLWEDEKWWLARVQTGRAFLETNSSWSKFPERLEAVCLRGPDGIVSVATES